VKVKVEYLVKTMVVMSVDLKVFGLVEQLDFAMVESTVQQKDV